MIRRVEFRNFKGLREVDLDLERFTVLVGPNASGKTSVLEGIYYLTRAGSTLAQISCSLPGISFGRSQDLEFRFTA